jgi:hypothetical protein
MDQSPTPAPSRFTLGTLGPRLTAFVAADVLLIVGFVVVLALYLSGSLGGSTSTPAASSPRPSGTSAATPASPSPSSSAPDKSAVAFALPSFNIACVIGSDGATCTIANSTATPAKPDTCKGVVGLKLTVTAKGSEMPCIEGAKPTAADPATPVLEYGQSKTVGDFTCTSSSTGVTCKDDKTGKGFKLARATSEIS